MARTAESGSGGWSGNRTPPPPAIAWVDERPVPGRNRENRGRDSCALSPFLCYVTTKAARNKRIATVNEGRRQATTATKSAVAHELVAFQRGGDLECHGNPSSSWYRDPVGAQYLSHAPQIDGLRPFVVQRDDVFDRTAEIGLRSGGEQHTTGTDVLGEASNGTRSAPERVIESGSWSLKRRVLRCSIDR